MSVFTTILWVYLQPLQIKSAVAVEGLKGYIYIEAYKQTHVKQVYICTVMNETNKMDLNSPINLGTSLFDSVKINLCAS